jgi:putative transposase
MARLNRLCPVGIPQHIVQRGNNRQVCFKGSMGSDSIDFPSWLIYPKPHQLP